VETPLLRLVAYEAEDNLRMATVRSIAAYESCKTLTERLGLSKYTIHMLRRNAHKELNKVYDYPA